MQREHVASDVAETMIRFICNKRIAKIVNFFYDQFKSNKEIDCFVFEHRVCKGFSVSIL